MYRPSSRSGLCISAVFDNKAVGLVFILCGHNDETFLREAALLESRKISSRYRPRKNVGFLVVLPSASHDDERPIGGDETRDRVDHLRPHLEGQRLDRI